MTDDRGCPVEFTNLCLGAVSGLFRPDSGTAELTAGLNRLVAHERIGEALLTWTALWARYAPPPGMDPAAAAEHIAMVAGEHADPTPPPWVGTLDMLLRCALAGDGPAVATVHETVAGWPSRERLSFTASLLASMGAAISDNDGATPRSVRLAHVYGAQVHPGTFAVLGECVDLTVEVIAGREEAAAARIGRLNDERVRWAAALAAETFGHFLDDTGVVFTAHGSLIEPSITGLLDWRDMDLDAGRPAGDLPACQAMRAGSLFAAGERPAALALIGEQDRPPGQRSPDTAQGVLFGACMFMGRVALELEGLIPTRAGHSPPPGHPG